MFDPDLIEGLSPDLRESVRQGVLLLASTGVLELQKQRLFARIAEGADNEDKDKLNEQILDYRRQSHGLTALIQFAERIKEEQENESE